MRSSKPRLCRLRWRRHPSSWLQLHQTNFSQSSLPSSECLRRTSHSFLLVITFLIATLTWSLLAGVNPNGAWAQVTTTITADGSLGTVVNANGTVHDITGGIRPGDGPNLFHSLGQLTVGTGDTANFLNDAGLPTANILSRVTGGAPSRIFGTLQTTAFGNASLYLMNPAGVVFGPTASLNVGGSVHVTTADYLKFGEEELFYTDVARESVLSIASPEAFGFLNNNPADITVDHSLFIRERALLKVTTGNNLSLIGGNLEILGDAGSSEGPGENVFSSLEAPSGQLTLVSVMSPGELPFTDADNLLSGDISSFGQLGEISSVGAGKLTTKGNPGGKVIIRAGKLEVIDTEISATTIGDIDHSGLGIDIEVQGDILLKGNLLGAAIGASSGSFGSEDPFGMAGDVRILSESLELQGVPDNFGNANIGSRSFGVGDVSGDGGVIDITTERLLLRPNSFFQTTSFGPADAGTIRINADTIEMFGTFGEQGNAFISTSSAGSGDAGLLDLTANTILIQGGAGFTGLASQVRSEGAGSQNGAPIRLTAHVSLQLLDGAQISSGLFAGDGQAGEIEINAPSVLISGLNRGGFPAGIFSSVNNPATGTAGGIRLGTPDAPVTDLTLNNGGQIVATSFGQGRGGDVTIDAQQIAVAGPTTSPQPFTQSGIFSIGGFHAESAGNITIRSDSLDILDGAQITARTAGMGPGGTIDITADTMTINGTDPQSGSFEGTRSGVYASTLLFPGGEEVAGGPAGNIKIKVTGNFDIGEQGTIQALSTTPGDAGTIEVRAGILHLTNDASITAQSSRNGGAGSIAITAEESFQSENSSITTEANEGDGGQIIVDANQLTLANTQLSASVKNVPEGTDSNTGLGDITLTSQTMQANGGSIRAETTGTRAAGNISVISDTFDLAAGARIEANTRGSGQGGTITVQSGQATLNTGATISAESSGIGNAGDIRLEAKESITLNNSQVTTVADQADGGNIKLTAPDIIQLTNTKITSSVNGGASTVGGNISIDPEFIILQNSQILANAFAGQGGNISLVADNAVIVDPLSVLDASSNLGVSGSVAIQAPIQNLSGTLAPLPEETTPVTTLYGAHCAAGERGNFSTFVNSKAESLTSSPGTFLSSPLLPPSFHLPTKTNASKPHQGPVILMASIAPLVLGQSIGSTTACP